MLRRGQRRRQQKNRENKQYIRRLGGIEGEVICILDIGEKDKWMCWSWGADVSDQLTLKLILTRECCLK